MYRVSPAIENLLRGGGKPAWQIALEVGVHPNQVYEVSRRIGVKPEKARRGEAKAAFPPAVMYRPRSREEILADLTAQLEGVVRRFNRQLRADRLVDPVARFSD